MMPETETYPAPGGERMAPLAVYTLLPSHAKYGGERMALATLHGLAGTFRPLLLAPPGPVHQEARLLGIDSRSFDGKRSFLRQLVGAFSGSRRLALLTTSVEHSLVATALNVGFRRRLAHLHVTHGGPEPEAYRRKRLLNHARRLRFVAVSAYAHERLCSYGVDPRKIVVIENFLSQDQALRLAAVRRQPSGTPRRVLVISRLEPLKRIDLVFDALDARPELAELEFRIVGDGPELDEMRERARRYPNVTFPGFIRDIEAELGAADLLLHCCPVEAFGLVPLEAMAAGVPVLVPDRGGAGALVEPGRTGFHFRTNDPEDLAARLAELASRSPERLREVTEAARRPLAERFGQKPRCADYSRLIEELLD